MRMKLYSNRALGGIFLLIALSGGWCFLAGFENAWNSQHIAFAIVSPMALVLSAFFYARK
jgi:hypothetical protein